MASSTTLADQAADAAQNVKEGVAAGVGTLKDRASAAMDQAKSTASDAAGGAKNLAEQGKNAGADAMHGLAGFAKDAAKGIESHVPGVAGVVRNVASSIDQASRDLHAQSIDDIGESIAKFAKSQPVAALATAFIAGVVISRIFSSTKS